MVQQADEAVTEEGGEEEQFEEEAEQYEHHHEEDPLPPIAGKSVSGLGYGLGVDRVWTECGRGMDIVWSEISVLGWPRPFVTGSRCPNRSGGPHAPPPTGHVPRGAARLSPIHN